MGPVPLGGRCEGGNVSIHWEVPSLAGTEGELKSLRGECSSRCAEGKVERNLHTGSVPTGTPQPEMIVCLTTGVGWGWVLRLRLQRSDSRERTGVGCMKTA